MRKRTIIYFLLAFFTALGLHPAVAAIAATTTCTTYSGNNVEAQNYSRWTTPVKSCLTSAPDGTLMRVQAGSSLNGILVEYYDTAYNLQSTKMIPAELPIFGGFHETDDNYYLVTGQNNAEESADVEVFRITKYDKSWNRIASTGLYDCNTTVPFDAGSLRMDTCGNYLLIHTSHEMYTTSDGLNHQANVTIEVNMNTMEITDSWTAVMNSSYGYVSHSFNQFVKIDNNKMITVDHGDAYPRSIALIQYPTDVSTGKFQSRSCSVTNILTFPGEIGQNTTGAAVGGFEISDSSYLIAGHSVIQDESNLTRSTRNVFVAAMDKSTSEVTINWLTSYAEGEGTTSTPHMVKLPNGNYMILWSRDQKVYYTQTDKNGQMVSDIYSHDGSLSDCVPSVINGKLIWYTWNNQTITFYDIDLSAPSQFHAETIENGHKYQQTETQNGYATLKCSVCQETTQIAVVTSFSMFWNTDGGNRYSSVLSREQYQGGQVYFWIYNPTGVAGAENLNTEMEVLSSDESVISVNRSASSLMGSLKMEKAGTAAITIRPRYNPSAASTYTITVYDPLELTSFTSAPATSQRFGSETQLSAKAIGGMGNTQYRFYLTDTNGETTELQGYSSNNTCTWIPNTTGTFTLNVDVKDKNGTTVTGTIEDYTVEKAEALLLKDIQETCCYGTASANRTLDIASILPANRGTTTYSVTTDDTRQILENVAVSEAGILTYSVKGSTAIGDSAVITVQASMENYETSSLRVLIQIADKKGISEKTDAAVAIVGNDAFIYGQSLQSAALNADSAIFIDDDGEEVDGTLNWVNPDEIPEVGAANVTWIFRPTDPQYSECSGILTLNVQKATVQAEAPEISDITYHPAKSLADITLGEGTAVTINGHAGLRVDGHWSWKDADIIPAAGEQTCTAVFTPEESNHYNTAEAEITFTVTKALPEIAAMPQASAITYGQTLSDSLLENGIAKTGEALVDGHFVWDEASTVPSVSDSETTAYAISFIPDDSRNYKAVTCGSITLTVNPAQNVPDAPGSAMNVANSITQVGQIALPEGWSWEDGSLELIPEEPMEAAAVYQDQINYENYRMVITIIRSTCEHIESDIIADVSPTCTGNGYGHVECTICNEILRTNILLEATGHQGGEATCISGARCTVCGSIYGEPNPENHMSIHMENRIDATCTETGYSGDTCCDDCGKLLTTGSTLEATGHLWDNGEITRQPTTSAAGIRTYTCRICHAVREVTIDKLTPSVKKGQTATVNNLKYKVTKTGESGAAEVILTANTNKKAASVKIPNTVTINQVTCKVVSVKAKAFYQNRKLKKVILGKNITVIKNKAFYGCKKLKTITIKSKKLKRVGKNAIRGISPKAKIKVPKAKVKKYKKLFTAKTGFRKTMKLK